MQNTTKAALSVLTGALMALAASSASAFPCSMGYVDGSLSANPINDSDPLDNYTCKDGAANDQNNDASDIGALWGGSWTELAKIDNPTGSASSGGLSIFNTFSSGSDLVAGNWSINNSIWTMWTSLVLVVKDGRAVNDVFFSTYLITPQNTSGDWAMPTRNLSHMSLYGTGRRPPQELPEPATLGLAGLAMLGLALTRRRKA